MPAATLQLAFSGVGYKREEVRDVGKPSAPVSDAACLGSDFLREAESRGS